MENPVVIIGDGWAALGLVGLFVPTGVPVCWIGGSRARISAPLASLEAGPGVEGWLSLARAWQVECKVQTEGSTLREFRNKAFREPQWSRAEGEARKEARDKSLWAPERRWVGIEEVRLDLAVSDLEENIRKRIQESTPANLRRIDGVPVQEVVESEASLKILLGSGETLEACQVYYADRWSLLSGIKGMPRNAPFMRNRHAVGVLQANFYHSVPVGVGVQESFFAPLHREAGEEVERHVWGYFSSDGKRSTWSLCLSPEEVEDNHTIAKKLRRLKNTLDRIFSGSDLIPQDSANFATTVMDEQVRFEEEAVFETGDVLIQPAALPKLPGVFFLTDGYGPSASLAQVHSLLSQEVK